MKEKVKNWKVLFGYIKAPPPNLKLLKLKMKNCWIFFSLNLGSNDLQMPSFVKIVGFCYAHPILKLQVISFSHLEVIGEKPIFILLIGPKIALCRKLYHHCKIYL